MLCCPLFLEHNASVEGGGEPDSQRGCLLLCPVKGVLALPHDRQVGANEDAEEKGSGKRKGGVSQSTCVEKGVEGGEEFQRLNENFVLHY